MTVRFLKAWNGFAEQDIVSSLSGAEETRLIGLGFATTDIYGNNGKPLVVPGLDAVLSGPQSARPDITGVVATTNAEDMVFPTKNKKSVGLSNSTVGHNRAVSGGPSATANGTYTAVEQRQAAGEFFGLRLGFFASQAQGASIENCKVAACPTDLNAGGSLTWNQVTFNGANTAALSNGSGSGLTGVMGGLVVSDLITLRSIDRADFPDRKPLIQIRTKMNGAFAGSSFVTGAMAPINAAIGLEEGGAIPASDVVTTPGDVSVVRDATWRFVQFVQFYYAKQVVSVWDFGDSLTRGQGSSGGYLSAGLRAISEKNQEQTDLIYTYLNYGVSGMSHTNFYHNLIKLLSSGEVPNILIFKAHSPNNNDYATEAGFDQCLARTLDVVNLCRKLGIRVILRNANKWGQPTLNTSWAIKFNQRLAATVGLIPGVSIIDEFNLLGSDPADPNKYNPAYIVGGGDNHYTDSGFALLKNEIKKLL